ncbi:hypothetical protein AOLI_G00194840 [Acnodon oligacanthus]
MSDSVYNDVTCIEELSKEDKVEMVVDIYGSADDHRGDKVEEVMVFYESADSVRGHDPFTETEDVNATKTLQTRKKVSGLSDTEVDNEVYDFLKTYGQISRVVKLNTEDPEYENSVIMEFIYGSAIEALQSRLPYCRPNSKPPLERKKDKPPSFAEFLLLLRTEEDKQASKSDRMKHHLGIPKAKVHSHFQVVYDSEECLHGFQVPLAEAKELSSETKMMKKQIAALQAQLASLKASEKPPPA